MFGSSNNQNQNTTDDAQANPAVPANDYLSSIGTPGAQNGANPALPAESTASPLGSASTAPHVEEVSPSNDSLVDNAANQASLPPAQPSENDGQDNSELMSIKQQALAQLSPIVGHLDQSPEDKFKTLMMMIQANDNQDLIKEAYETAQQIPEEKAKSQALLDVINEINYFTQKQKEQS